MRKSDVLGRKLRSWGHLKIPRFHKNRERCGSTPRFLSTSLKKLLWWDRPPWNCNPSGNFAALQIYQLWTKTNPWESVSVGSVFPKKYLTKLPRNSCVEEKTANFVRYSHSCKACWCFCCCDFLRCLCQHQTDLWLYGWLIESPDLVALFYDWSTYPPNVQ